MRIDLFHYFINAFKMIFKKFVVKKLNVSYLSNQPFKNGIFKNGSKSEGECGFPVSTHKKFGRFVRRGKSI